MPMQMLLAFCMGTLLEKAPPAGHVVVSRYAVGTLRLTKGSGRGSQSPDMGFAARTKSSARRATQISPRMPCKWAQRSKLQRCV